MQRENVIKLRHPAWRAAYEAALGNGAPGEGVENIGPAIEVADRAVPDVEAQLHRLELEADRAGAKALDKGNLPAKPTRPRTVSELHQMQAADMREAMGRIAAMPAPSTGALPFGRETENDPPANQGVGFGFAPQPSAPADRVRAGWQRAIADADGSE